MPSKPKPRKQQLDRVDAEALREMMQSRGWKLFAKRFTRLRDRKRRELEQELDQIQTAAVRGFLSGLASVAAIPDILQREGNRGGDGDE